MLHIGFNIHVINYTNEYFSDVSFAKLIHGETMVEFLVFDVVAPTQFTNLECKSYPSSVDSGIYSDH